MLFNSFSFFAFFLIVYVLYLRLGHRWQNLMLLAASSVFYGLWSWKALILLWISIVVDYSVGMGLAATQNPRQRKLLLTISITSSLSLLGFFKYYNFFVDNLAALLSRTGVDARWLHLPLLLPIGISFYTFHTMSYVIDVYKGRLKECRHFVDFALFVSFFPQLVAGPIARAKQLLPQMEHERTIDPQQFVGGLFLIFWGLFKKVVVADGCGRIVGAVFAHDAAHAGLDKLLAVYAFAFEIYGDFSGYSDMARGLAKLMGFELLVNFQLPYFASNPSDFWRRWHISLSTWLRDYLYIPLGGSRHGPRQTYRNLFLTMLIGGVWHGASWTMVTWGAYQGVCLIVHRLFTGDESRGAEQTRPVWRRALQIGLMFQITCLGWLIFRADGPAQVGRFLLGIGTDLHAGSNTLSYASLLVQLVTPLMGYEWLLYTTRDIELFERWDAPRRTWFAVVIAGAVSMFLVFHRSLVQGEIPFIYFQF